MPVVLGLRANLSQFLILVIVNALVGGMVGLQRALVPLIGEREFGIASAALATSFIVSFGLTKAAANLVSGTLADRFGRKGVLIAGWVLGLPVAPMIMFAPSWGWIVAANVLLGLNQGLAWSMTVNMKMDLVGPRRRGLALGLNEFAGYAAVGLTAWLSGLIALRAGLRPEPFYLGIAYAAAGLVLSLIAVRDTQRHVERESLTGPGHEPALSFRDIFGRATWRDRDLATVSQSGFFNNFNDGVVWGLLPLLLAARGLGVGQIALIAGLYPVSWGLGQLATGWASDHAGRKPLIAGGMLVQGVGLMWIGVGAGGALFSGIAGALLLGIGTAMAYPTLLAAVGDLAAPAWRARALAVYRFWRDLGFAAGALAGGAAADVIGYGGAVQGAGILTALSGVAVLVFLRETLRRYTAA